MSTALQNENQEDWEVVSGSKSLTTESIKSLLQSIDSENTEFKEKGEDTQKQKESSDWYTTILPATPANTPEYTPTPPSYPSAGLKKDFTNLESGELFPIKEVKEDAAEDTKKVSEDKLESQSATGEGTPKYFEYTPADSDNEGASSSRRYFTTVEDWVYRIASYFLVFNIIRWIVVKIWKKIKTVLKLENNQ